jgi:hypothetical protein
MHILAFALHLLGTSRKEVAALVEMPQESVKTLLRVVLRDGFPALRDRRLSAPTPIAAVPPSPTQISVSHDQEGWTVQFDTQGETPRIPATHPVQARTVVLSLLNAGVLTLRHSASVLGICDAHCCELARKLVSHDVAEALVDKREGQQHDFRVGPKQKAELMQQLVARAITGHDTSSEALAAHVNEQTDARVSARTIRWHIRHLGLSAIRHSLPQLVATLKKTPPDRG